MNLQARFGLKAGHKIKYSQYQKKAKKKVRGNQKAKENTIKVLNYKI